MVTEHDLEKELHKLERAFMELERDLKRKRFTPDQKIKLRTEQRKILIEKHSPISFPPFHPKEIKILIERNC